MLSGEKILITEAAGKIAFPIARALAKSNEAWGVARLRDPAARDKLVAAGVRPIALDLSTGDFSQLPEDFNRHRVPLTIIRICWTYGPEGGGAPADRLEMMLAHKPIRLYPEKPNNYNPIYEDDYVELGIRAMEVAATPPVVVNWAGSETVSVEEYCAYMGELVGIEPIFDYTPEAHTPLWPDVTLMHKVLGHTKVPWHEGSSG